ncbi:hypothetical protein HPB50_026168 [Hyalomma asiaticum]|uniref:Uncharacterized protein n=1 Tax=Hyalomma asiaticum TaxID=266040 RepID=A0ACB7SKQ3_HYAAI|nr:hypothetical protein HPB50_026168 [Hyalomma asiaticum]
MNGPVVPGPGPSTSVAFPPGLAQGSSQCSSSPTKVAWGKGLPCSLKSSSQDPSPDTQQQQQQQQQPPPAPLPPPAAATAGKRKATTSTASLQIDADITAAITKAVADAFQVSDAKLEARFNAMDAKFETRLNTMQQAIDARFTNLEQAIANTHASHNALKQHTENAFASVNQRIGLALPSAHSCPSTQKGATPDNSSCKIRQRGDPDMPAEAVTRKLRNLSAHWNLGTIADKDKALAVS